jgi:hypothetical protein
MRWRGMSTQISETMTCVLRFLMPGIDMINSTVVRKGSRLVSTWHRSLPWRIRERRSIEMKAQQEAMVLGHPATKRLTQFLR